MRLSDCPVRATIDVVEGKWKPIIINALKLGTLRFGQLLRHAPEATRKVLAQQLRELEADQSFRGRRQVNGGCRLTTRLLPIGKLSCRSSR
jgi:DNA-binding HxlR family transcriptional regulator